MMAFLKKRTKRKRNPRKVRKRRRRKRKKRLLFNGTTRKRMTGELTHSQNQLISHPHQV
jgi:hypothetical protein